MPRSVEVKKGQCFQDGTGLTVRVGDTDGTDRVHFSVIEDGFLFAPHAFLRSGDGGVGQGAGVCTPSPDPIPKNKTWPFTQKSGHT